MIAVTIRQAAISLLERFVLQHRIQSMQQVTITDLIFLILRQEAAGFVDV